MPLPTDRLLNLLRDAYRPVTNPFTPVRPVWDEHLSMVADYASGYDEDELVLTVNQVLDILADAGITHAPGQSDD